MKTITEHIRAHLLNSLGYAEPRTPAPSLDELRKTEWSSLYESLCRNRMIMGYFRYGPISRPLGEYDVCNDAIIRIRKYQETRNLEYLVDAGNMCMLAFEEGIRKKEHFCSIDDGHHTQKRSER